MKADLAGGSDDREREHLTVAALDSWAATVAFSPRRPFQMHDEMAASRTQMGDTFALVGSRSPSRSTAHAVMLYR